MKKLTCHCGAIEAEVKIPIGGVEKIMRCNCSICKKKDPYKQRTTNIFVLLAKN